MSLVNTSFGRILTQNELAFANPRQPLRIHMSTSKVGLSSVPLGTTPESAAAAEAVAILAQANFEGK